MIYKIAKCPEDMVRLTFNMQGEDRMMKTAAGNICIEPGSDKAKIIEAEIKKHPTALFFRAKAIKADEPNSNGDYFSEEELKKSYKTFEGVPFFTNHDNQNVENARGKVIFAEWVPEEKATYTISFVDREAYPHICRSIEEEYISGVSMGAVNGDALITMPDLSLKCIRDIKKGDKVLSPFGNIRKVIKTYSATLNKSMYKIKTKGYDNNLLFTEDHPVYVKKSKSQKAEFIEIKNIKSGYYILLPLYGISPQYRGNINICADIFITREGSKRDVFLKGDVFLASKIDKIIEEKAFQEPVYDLKVEEDESYIADGIAVHNCSVEYSVCNICGNRAERTEQYCSHIKERKGRTFSGKARNVTTGETKEFRKEPVFEYNYGIKFIELSAVVDPACPSCRIQGLIKNDEIVKKVANLQNTLYMIKTAAIEKQAGQEEIQQLNEVLKTLEGISIKLIQNRQQVEVEFASDLVGILSELQTFVDELVGAGYGNAQSVPGVAQPPVAAPGAPQLPPSGIPEAALPVAQETPIPGAIPAPAPAPAVGTISGAPTSPLVKSPKLPITAPAKPRAIDTSRMQKIAKTLDILIKSDDNIGEDDMAKRLTADEKNKQKKVASEVLSTLWKEKHNFFEYINKVPSVQDNSCKLSVKKRDDSFIIVAESKTDEQSEIVWTYETLTDQEKEMIKGSPKAAASYFMDKFANNLKTKKGEAVMTSNIKEAGAKSVNKAPEVVTQAQLEEGGLYHSRTGDEKNQITERQLDDKRSGEREIITEAQLNEKSNKLNPRTDKDAEVITEAQLEVSGGVSPRTDNAPNQITQAQLEPNRTGTDPDVITEKQLQSVDSPWARAAKRNPAMFKSAGDHMKSVVDVMANTVIATGCTPVEVSQIASSLVSSTKDRYELGNAILDNSTAEDVDYSKRLAYWSKKNIKVAGVGTKEIASTLVQGLQKVASDVTINPDTIIDALDVVSDSKEGEVAISRAIDQKLESAQKETIKSSKKEELRKVLTDSLFDKGKESRDQERKDIVASLDKEDAKQTRESERTKWVKTVKNPDTIVETTFEELGFKSKDEEGFKPAIKSFARGALASQNIKLAAITNVTISGDTISIAVQTDAGEQGVEIPVGEEIAPAEGEVVPEADMTGEGLEANLSGGLSPDTGLPAGAMPGAPASAIASSKKMLKKVAQIGGQGGGIPGTPGAVTAPGAPEAGLPGATSTDVPVQSLTTDEPADELPDEIPTAGQQQPLGAICPECGSSDVDVTNEEGNINGTCNACGAEYEALVKKEIEFKIIKPTRSVGAEEATGAPEAPEVPALPVAAQTKLDKGSIVRVSSNQAKHGHVCPACGMKQCKAAVESAGHAEYKCPACNTDVQKDFMVNVNNPEESYLRVKWDLVPNVDGCAGCREAAVKFASMMKIQNMIKTASNGTTKFPMANCIERVARKWGGNSVATFGPCKGKPLADCVCSQLEKLGLSKVRYLEKLGSVYAQKDPMDECIEDQMKNKYDRKEATTICNCLKKKFASKEDSNVFLMAFADDIKSGKEKILTAQDLDAINDTFAPENIEDDGVIDDDVDIAEPLDAIDSPEAAEETVTIEVSEETAKELADAAQTAVETKEIPAEVPAEVKAEVPAEIITDTKVEDVKGDVLEEEKDVMAMQTHKIIKIGEAIVKVAATPTKVKDIEGNVEAKVPRSEQKLGDESKADSLMNKPNKDPEVPRKDAYMGKENEADSLINKELKLPDVAVNSAYMGKEKEVQKGMPAINNEIKGTVIAKDDKAVKEAKKMKEVDTVEKDVEAKVPRNDQKLGEESKADSLINEPNKGPDVPRSKEYMGKEKEADSLINTELQSPDVPIDNAFMGHEKEVQKGMPGINDEILKNVQQKRDVQLERIAVARRIKAVETAAKLLATKRITEEAYENVIEALSRFEIDKIASVADNMYPRVKKQAESQDAKEVYAGPAIVMESKEIKPSDPVSELSKKLASSFTIGNKSFDENLTRYGEK